jgi:hypothetical protein
MRADGEYPAALATSNGVWVVGVDWELTDVVVDDTGF